MIFTLKNLKGGNSLGIATEDRTIEGLLKNEIFKGIHSDFYQNVEKCCDFILFKVIIKFKECILNDKRVSFDNTYTVILKNDSSPIVFESVDELKDYIRSRFPFADDDDSLLYLDCVLNDRDIDKVMSERLEERFCRFKDELKNFLMGKLFNYNFRIDFSDLGVQITEKNLNFKKLLNSDFFESCNVK